MHLGEIILLLMIGFTGSFFSGLLGIGGAIINFPMILFIPLWFGYPAFSSQEVSSISMFQVFFSSLSGVVAHRRSKSLGEKLPYTLLLYMGVPLMAGSLVGGILSHYISGETINFIYGVLALIALLLMLRPTKVSASETETANDWSKSLAITLTLLIGLVAGVVGAGGAFLLVPVMLTIFKIPTRTVIASSLSIVFLSAVGGIIGKIMAGHIPFMPTLIVVIGSLLGAPLGAYVSHRLNVRVLRYVLAIVVGLTTIKIWTSILM